MTEAPLIAENESLGVLSVPTTYPPRSVGSFLAAGVPDGEDSGFAFPPSVENELRKRFDYRMTKSS
jgi:predicted AlkP superfamily phosphohydrolase/phosphomutase